MAEKPVTRNIVVQDGTFRGKVVQTGGDLEFVALGDEPGEVVLGASDTVTVTANGRPTVHPAGIITVHASGEVTRQDERPE
ncbi:hypothetical protein GCM10022243_30000 [Saccharothrix violaceirubra]|uniref:Uncharacterized protein n=1 Tax=Saccharothrix violaceirubra TaxID=413306 RepID=A0A7W7T4W3_9PSEU|nr:hypothetical protein [Saccharothrix violaceirubra]MBB4966624.1 hypothetical protein [Saccharothrix violaceirubra]